MGTTASTAFVTQGSGGSGGEASTSSSGSGLVISPVRTKVLAAKMTVPFLKSDTDAPSQCWTLWSESVPPKMEIPAGESLRYRALASADFALTEWAMDGPQNAVVQRMVDFFWAVGAPAHQIDLLNDAGVRLNPARLGSWTRLSAAGAMDAGWAFCERVPLDQALAVVRRGDVTDAVAQWAAAHGVAACREVTHDVSGIPPQTTQLRVELPGADAAALAHTLAQIDADVARVAAYDALFAAPEGRDQLRRVLTVYSTRHPRVGYCQTMHRLAAMLLTRLPEEEAYWMLATLVNRVMPREYLTDGMRGLLVDVQVLGAVARQALPRLLATLDAAGVALDGFLARWLPSLFLGSASQRVADRIFDLVTYKGFTALFRITVGLLSALADELDSDGDNSTATTTTDDDDDDDDSNNDDCKGKGDGGEGSATTAAASASAQPSDGTPRAEARQGAHGDGGSGDAGESRTGTILALLQSLPERITETELVERTYAVHIPSREKIDEMRRAAWAQFEDETPAPAPAPAPVPLSPVASHRPPAPTVVLPTNITIIPQSAEPLRCPGLQLGGPPAPATS